MDVGLVEPDTPFPHPYTPYDIQVRFMKYLYTAIMKKKIAILESPTGTGKTLSIICSAFHWLSQHGVESDEESSGSIGISAAPAVKSDEPDWLSAFDSKHALDEKLHKRQQRMARLREIDDRVKAAVRTEEEEKAFGHSLVSRRNAASARFRESSGSKHARSAPSLVDGDDDDDVLLSDYEGESSSLSTTHMSCHGDSVASTSTSSLIRSSSLARTASIAEMMRREMRESSVAKPGAAAEGAFYKRPKIFFVSRTHSQIAQFMSEIHKTHFARTLRIVVLGSRRALCSNPEVRSLGSEALINEKCMELVDSKKAAQSKRPKVVDISVDKTPAPARQQGCPYWGGINQSLLVDRMLGKMRDVEESVALGQEMNACAYFGSRKATAEADVVAMPYTMLLSERVRDSMNIDLTGSVLIIDEAHNLIDAINSVHSYVLSVTQLAAALRQLRSYLAKYQTRMNSTNSVYCLRLLSVMESLLKVATPKAVSAGSAGAAPSTYAIFALSEFLFGAGLDSVNFYEILTYIENVHLVRKLRGFVEREATKEVAGSHAESESLTSQALQGVCQMLGHLTSEEADGRVIVQFEHDGGRRGYIKYINLNPGAPFRSIIDKCRSVVLAGGTMHPVSDLLNHVFTDVPTTRILSLSCGHIVPRENLSVFSATAGPTGVTFDFRFSQRQNTALMDELGRALINTASIVPSGMVVFLPSYDYEAALMARWGAPGSTDLPTDPGSIYGQLSKRKKVFREPRGGKNFEETLRQYAACISSSKTPDSVGGAIIFSVVGGKLSEGINFSDDLARVVVVVGLPFANAQDPELIERMAFLDRKAPGSGKEYYENLCLKAVNQSIGRSIRHIGDYAVIHLLDQRFQTNRIASKLPQWIQSRLEPQSGWSSVVSNTAKFFRQKRELAVLRTLPASTSIPLVNKMSSAAPIEPRSIGVE